MLWLPHDIIKRKLNSDHFKGALRAIDDNAALEILRFDSLLDLWQEEWWFHENMLSLNLKMW